MKTTKKLLAIIVGMLGFFLLPLAAQTPPDNPRYFENAKVIRVKHISGNGFVQRSYEEGLEEATPNLPIFEKDLVGTSDGRIEVYLGRLNYLRFNAYSEAVFEEVPMLRKTSLRLRILKGSIYLDVSQIDREKDIEIQTPDCGLFVLEPGIYRISVREGEATEVSLFDGSGELCGSSSSRLIRDNQQAVLSGGEFVKSPFYFNTSLLDDFDRWNRERISDLEALRYNSSRYLDEGYEEYEYELNRNGRWRYESSYGRYVWIPYNIDTGWTPYSYGRWVHNPFYGYVWSSYHDWGFFTHHYGRWHYSHSWGWHWLPGYRWSPAWVPGITMTTTMDGVP